MNTHDHLPRIAGPGRPKDPLKHTAIIAAARALFFAKGVEDVGMEEIAAAAEVSKMTVYGHFGDKAALLGAVVELESQRMTASLEQMPEDGRSLEQRLVEFGITLMGFLTSPEILAFDRLMAAQAMRHPEMALAMVEAGPRFGMRKVAEQVARAIERGELVPVDPMKAAGQLAGLWHGSLHMECRMGVRSSPTHAELADHVADGVRAFLKIYRR